MSKAHKPKPKKKKATMEIDIDVFDRSLLHYLLKTKGRATTNRLAKRTTMSWNTADKHLKKLKRMDLVKSEKEKKKKFWKIDRRKSIKTKAKKIGKKSVKGKRKHK